MSSARTAWMWRQQATSKVGEIFITHPSSLGETYWEHQAHATQFATALITAGLACLVHGIVPALYPRKASGVVASLHEQMLRMRRLTPGIRSAVSPTTQYAAPGCAGIQRAAV
jgi:uncharacterized protein YjeT (DUF2065 family)